MIPTFPTFKELELSDRIEIEKMTSQFPPYSDFHFTIMWSWDIHDPVLISRLNNNLIVRQGDCLTGQLFYSFIGKQDVSETLNIVLEWLQLNNFPQTIKWIPEETKLCCDGLNKYMVEDRDSHDYVYDVNEIINASGSIFSTYRRKLNKFQNAYPKAFASNINLTQTENRTMILNLFDTWVNGKTGDAFFNHLFENKALNKLLLNIEKTSSVSCVGLFNEHNLIGFSIVDIINKEFSCIPFIKANKDFVGSFQYLMYQTVKYLNNKGNKFINFEPDLGLPSLRVSKQLYYPVRFLRKFTLEKSS